MLPASWQVRRLLDHVKEDEYRVRCEQLKVQQSSKQAIIEEELKVLRVSITKAAKAKVAVEQLKSSNGTIEKTVRKPQLDLEEQHSQAARFERELSDHRRRVLPRWVAVDHFDSWCCNPPLDVLNKSSWLVEMAEMVGRCALSAAAARDLELCCILGVGKILLELQSVAFW